MSMDVEYRSKCETFHVEVFISMKYGPLEWDVKPERYKELNKYKYRLFKEKDALLCFVT